MGAGGLLRHNLPRHLCQAISQVYFGQKQLSSGYDLQQIPNKITLSPSIDTDTGVGDGGGVPQCRLCSLCSCAD